MSSRVLNSLVSLLAFFSVAVFGKTSFSCLTDAETDALVDDFRTIASIAPGYIKAAKRTLTNDFTSISDGVNFADQIPVSLTPSEFTFRVTVQDHD